MTKATKDKSAIVSNIRAEKLILSDKEYPTLNIGDTMPAMLSRAENAENILAWNS
jgi:hypothetical protein